VPRACFRVDELVALTEGFYRRNYIEGLFLSSGVLGSPDLTMEMLIRVARTLRLVSGFAGYIHLKIIPGCSPLLVREAGFWADRLSKDCDASAEDLWRRYFAAIANPERRNPRLQRKLMPVRYREFMVERPAGPSS
jgi:predicted DNA-binding helix-hairpin-helix protein